MTETTIVKEKYVVTATTDCTVTATRNGKTYTLLTLKAGQQGSFQAISDSVTITDLNAIILPFSNASITLGGGGGGGISEEELINYGVLEEWTTEDVRRIKQLGSLTGAGSTTPIFKPINGVPFTYSLTNGIPIEFNRIEICVKTNDIPSLFVGGMRCAYLSHRMVDDYFYITYNTYDYSNPEAKLKLSDIEIMVIGATSVGGGIINDPSTLDYTKSDNVDYYPYAHLYYATKIEHVGIETQVYNVVKKEKETNKILPLFDETTTNTNSNIDYFIQHLPNVDVILNTGKLSTTDDELVVISATLYVYNNAYTQDAIHSSFRSCVELDSRNAATAAMYRIH